MDNDKLAIDGGMPIREKSWGSWPHFEQDEIDIVTDVLKSGKVNYWTGSNKEVLGQKVRGYCGEFEARFAEYLDSKYAICVSNGTVAIELCLHALDLGNGDEVIVPNRTFIATASACVAQGTIPVFADIDLQSQGLTLGSIKAVVTDKTKVIICVHLGGWSCEMDEILAFAKEKNIKVIEDCAQSLGAKYKGKMLGTLGDMAAFSFCQDKIITTGGEGGMIATNDPALYERAWEYKDHGKNFHFFNQNLSHPLLNIDKKKEWGMYSSIGTNFRMTEMQAAIGLKQLEKLPGWIEKRRYFASLLDKGLSAIDGIQTLTPPDYIHNAYYKYYAHLDLDKIKSDWNREKIIKAISAEGVVCQYGTTWGIGLEMGWKKTCLIDKSEINIQLKEHFPNDHKLGLMAIMFQVHPTLDEESIEDTIKAVSKVMNKVVE